MTKKLPRYELIFNDKTMEGVYGVSLVNDPAIQIKALKFSNINDCNFSSDDISDEVIELLLSKGESIDNNDWDLIDEKTVEFESDYNIDLASIPSQTDGESEQDNEVFKIRYQYTPNKTSQNSRNFCIKMATSNLLFKKEDLVWSNANAGFGAKGADSYDLFKFKGGVNCQHSWSRKIFLKKNNKELSVFEALKHIQSLDKKSAKEAKLPVNPKEVSQVASAENNYWKLSTEIKDFRMASEEKRILTSPVLIPEQNIYRVIDGEECNVFLSAETIENLQQNFFKNQYQKNSTLEHLEVIDGVFFFESWIVKNPKNDKANELGFDVGIGTWMMSMKVENQAIWDEYVKTGLITGFSIDSRLGVAKKNKNEKMNYSKVKEMVMKSILLESQLKEFKTDDGKSVFAESLDADMVVFDSENNPLVDAEFTIDGKVYKTGTEGQISSIEDAPASQADAQPADVNAADSQTTDTQTADAQTADSNSELEAAKKKIDELEIENQSLKEELVKIKEEAVNLANQPKTEGINLNDTNPIIDLDSMSSLERYRYYKSLEKNN